MIILIFFLYRKYFKKLKYIHIKCQTNILIFVMSLSLYKRNDAAPVCKKKNISPFFSFKLLNITAKKIYYYQYLISTHNTFSKNIQFKNFKRKMSILLKY